MSSPVRLLVGAAAVAASFLGGPAAFVALLRLGGASLVRSAIRGSLAEETEGVRQSVASAEAPIRVIYGTRKVGVQFSDIRVDQSSPKDRDLYRVGVLCLGSSNGEGIDGVDKVWIDETLAIGNPVESNLLRDTEVQPPFDGASSAGSKALAYGLHLGADDQVTDTHLDTTFAGYGPNTAGRGVAYLALRQQYHKEIWASGMGAITVQVRGVRVYDPRNPTGGPDGDGFVFSANPALCILDYLTSPRYGLGAPLSEIDTQSFVDIANYCEETEGVPGGTQARYTCDAVLSTGEPVQANLQRLLSSCRGRLVYQGGKFRLVVHRAITPEAFELTEENIVGEIQLHRAGSRETANRIVATYPDADQDWIPDDVGWPASGQANGFLTSDGGFENVREIDLPCTTDRYMAQQLAMVALRESRADLSIGLTAKDEALKAQVGDLVPVSHSTYGFVQKPFWVVAIAPAVGAEGPLLSFVLEEYDPAAYVLDALSTKDTPPDTILPDPVSVAAPSGLTLTSDSTTARATQDGQRVPVILVEWTDADEPYLHHTRIRFRAVGDPDWEMWNRVEEGVERDLIYPVSDGEEYEVELVAVNTLGRTSAAVTDTVTAGTLNAGGEGAAGAPPTPEWIPVSANLLMERWNAQAAPGAAGDDVTEFAYRIEQGDQVVQDWTAWAALDGSDQTGIIRVPRDFRRTRHLLLKVRDEKGRESDPATKTIESGRSYHAGGTTGIVLRRKRDEGDTTDETGRHVGTRVIRSADGATPLLDTEGLTLDALDLEPGMRVGTTGRGIDTVDGDAIAGRAADDDLDANQDIDRGLGRVTNAKRLDDDVGIERVGSKIDVFVRGVGGPAGIGERSRRDAGDFVESGGFRIARVSPVYSTDGVTKHLDPDTGELLSILLGPTNTLQDVTGRVNGVGWKETSTVTKQLARGLQSGFAVDGGSVTLVSAFSSGSYEVLWLPGGVLQTDGLTGKVGPIFQAANKSGSGFDASLRLTELAGSITNRSATFASGATQDEEANKGFAAEAWDDRYTWHFDVTVQQAVSGIDSSVEVEFWYNTGSGWVLAGTQVYTNPTETSLNYLNQTRVVVINGMGLDDDFGLTKGAEEGFGGSISGDDVTWEEAIAPSDETATPAGAPPVPFLVIGG